MNKDEKKRGKKIIWSVSISAAVILGAWILIRITNIYNIYTIPTTSCSPTFEPGQIISASILKPYHKGDYVCFKSKTTYFYSEDIYVSQLIATEGDTLEIKSGIAYINGKLADDTTKLKFSWIRNDLNVNLISAEFEKYMSEEIYPVPDSGYCVQHMTIQKAKQYGAQRMCLPKEYIEPERSFIGSNNWNRDWMGPYIIPKDHVFLLGCNRDNSLDCRYRGPIPEKDIVATVLK